MAWTETNATAWGELTISLGDSTGNETMQSALTSIGNVKQDSVSIEMEDGDTKEWKAVGGRVVDKAEGEPTVIVKAHVKNLNMSALSKFWKVTEASGALSVTSFRSDKKFAVKIEPSVIGGEIVEIPMASVKANIAYDENGGYGLDVSFTVLSPGAGKKIIYVKQKTA